MNKFFERKKYKEVISHNVSNLKFIFEKFYFQKQFGLQILLQV